MNQRILNEGIIHLVSVEPNFKRFVPDHQIEFFLRPKGFRGICALVIEQQISVKAAESIKKRIPMIPPMDLDPSPYCPYFQHDFFHSSSFE